MKSRNRKLAFAAFAALVLSLGSTALAQSGPTLKSTTFFGGSGDQRGTGIKVKSGAIYISGVVQQNQSPSDSSLILKYSIPPGTTTWSRTFASGTALFSVAATSEGVYVGGWNYSLTNDPVGGKEVKTLVSKFAVDGTSGAGPDGSTWTTGGPGNRGPFFSYSGVETYQSLSAALEGGSNFIYAAGGGQPCSYFAYFVAKYDSLGNFVAAATDSAAGIRFDRCSIPSVGGSGSSSVAVHNGGIYVAGGSGWSGEGDSGGRAVVWKYDPNLNLQWRLKDTSLLGYFNGITSLGGSVYAVGFSYVPGQPGNYLIEKFDESGNILWRTSAGGSNEDSLTGVVALGTRLFGVGYTRSEGSGGADIVVLEIDPGSGAVLSTTLYGGPQDDFARGAATDGTDLFVVAESRSFASAEGNQVGQDDIVLLDYGFNRPPVADAGADQTVECASHSGTLVTLDGLASTDPDGNTLSYEWKDAGNNVLGTSASLNLTLSLGTHTFTLTVNDGQGGTATDNVQIIVEDTTPPVLTLAQDSTTAVLPIAGASGASVDVLAASGASATDVCCEPNPTLLPAGVSDYPVGTTTVMVIASDCHLNTSVGQPFTVNVVYNFTGFLPPIRNDGTSIFRSGRTIPVKFQLTAADGSIVSNAVATLGVAKVLDQVIGVFEEAESAGASNTDNLFHFDPTSGQYIYNLNTSGYTTGTYVLRATLNDGTTHDVYVSVR